MRPADALWKSDRGLTALLAFLGLALLVVVPLVAEGMLSTFFVELAFGLILVSGVGSVTGRRWPKFAAAALVVLTLSTKSVRIVFPSLGLELLDTVLSLLTLLILAWLVLTQVFREGRITLHRVQGAVAAYLLLGFAWSVAYQMCLLLRPDAIRFPGDPGGGVLVLPRLLYFSFVTLTTVGYGDIVPVHPGVRSLAVVEALVGQLYPAILIARLVSLELISRSERR